MDEKLKTTIEKIVQLSKQNPEFDIELRKALNVGRASNDVPSANKRIEHIEKYLGLDYSGDNQPSLIDYSFIQESEVRAQLVSDNREMMRFRYGTRYHAICFDEFCRYAHLQAEMLLNYFYDLKNNNFNAVLVHIKTYNPTANLDNAKSLGSISYNSKLWAFKTEFNLDYKIYTVLDNLRRVRNDSSHRSPEKEEKSIHDYRKQLVNMGMPLKQDGEVDYYKLEDGSPRKLLYNNMVNNKDWYKDYLYLIWLHNESYESIVNAIEELKQTVKANI